MFKTWREQYRASQELKRQIEREQWEQEKQWREEDRAARQKALAENAVDLAAHNENLKAATGVSYLTLACHEDTWSFMAARAFGIWLPSWTQSTWASSLGATYGPNGQEAQAFTVDPNLPKGRIKKVGGQAGMQEILLSGHNLVQLLNALREGTAEDDVAVSARCGRLYGKLAEFVHLVDPTAPAGKTTGIRYQIDDSVDSGHVTKR
ncbi:hypothetical protein [Streptomyces sp. NPDC047065]|uniref:hypothetical protein n=1 Tax=Streptomyces sp. NPDC047065 TaxID=3154606 RepID=UPI0033E68FA7